MENLKGLQIKNLDFHPRRMGDLIYHEGPFLSHFVDEKNPTSHYFYFWADVDDRVNRWMVFKVAEEDLHNFFFHGFTLRQLAEKCSFVYFLDLNKDVQPEGITLVSRDELPEKYLPGPESDFDEQQFEPYALVLKEQVRKYRTRFRNLQKFWLGKAAF